MAKIGATVEAVEDLERLVVTHSLPVDARARIRRSLQVLERFPRAGRELGEPWSPVRVLIGPWPWLLMLYSYDEADEVVLVLGFQDARAYQAVTTHER